MTVAKIIVPAMLLVLAGCNRTGEIEATGGVGVTAVRSPCPIVGVPAGTGDVTLFNPADSRESTAIDVTAAVTNVRSTCDDRTGEQVTTNLTFDIQARRASADGPREVTLPYFVTLVRGGSAVVAKRIGNVTLRFAAGQLRASASAQATTSVARSAATLPLDVRGRLTRRRRAGQEAAAMDPLTDPAVRAAVLSATFEALVGFQLTEDQLRYNVTR